MVSLAMVAEGKLDLQGLIMGPDAYNFSLNAQLKITYIPLLH